MINDYQNPKKFVAKSGSVDWVKSGNTSNRWKLQITFLIEII